MIPRRALGALLRWAIRTMASRVPDFIIGDRYMLRWFVLPRNNYFNIYLHRFLHSDYDGALHDHPYANASIVLDGGYWEHCKTPVGIAMRWRAPGSVVLRPAAAAHRVALTVDPQGHPLYATSLFVTGPRVREWGFHCPHGWVPWHQFIDARDYGSRSEKGAGCP